MNIRNYHYSLSKQQKPEAQASEASCPGSQGSSAGAEPWPPTNSDVSLLLPNPHLPAACRAHDQLRVPRHVHVPEAARRTATTTSLTATLPPALAQRPEFRKHEVPTNHNPKSVSVFRSAPPPTTELPAGQIPCETRPEKTTGRDGS